MASEPEHSDTVKQGLARFPIPAVPRRMVRDQVDRAVNLYKRLFTAAGNPLPDCLIIGAQRGGTTSLYRNIVRHPGVQGATRKEVHFFDQNHEQGLNWYRSFFPAPTPAEPPRLSIEATPYYLFHPAVPQRVKEALPQARFIALLRDPVERAYSHYLHARERGFEPLGLAAALDAEAERLRGEEHRLLTEPRYASHAHRFQSYQSRGLYARQLTRWLDCFPRDRFLLLKAEDLYADSRAVTSRAIQFLGLPDDAPIRLTWNNSTEDKAPMPDDIRDRLRRYFEPANAELRAIAGPEFHWDDASG